MVTANHLPMTLSPEEVSARPCHVLSESLFTQSHIQKPSARGHAPLLWVCRTTLHIALCKLSYTPFLLSGMGEERGCSWGRMLPTPIVLLWDIAKPQVPAPAERASKSVPKVSRCFGQRLSVYSWEILVPVWLGTRIRTQDFLPGRVQPRLSTMGSRRLWLDPHSLWLPCLTCPSSFH